jgi:hypothetical protein
MMVEKNSVWFECALAGSAFVNTSTIRALVGQFDQKFFGRSSRDGLDGLPVTPSL